MSPLQNVLGSSPGETDKSTVCFPRYHETFFSIITNKRVIKSDKVIVYNYNYKLYFRNKNNYIILNTIISYISK